MHLYSERKEENTVIQCAEPVVPPYGSIYSVIPDTFDSEYTEDLLYSVKAEQEPCSFKHPKHLPTNVNGEANLLHAVGSTVQGTSYYGGWATLAENSSLKW